MNNNLKLLGLLFAMLLLTGCPRHGETYITAEEQYVIGWLLHNVDENTPTTLGYSKEDLAVYNYSFNFPSTQPEGFDNILFWIPPIQENESVFIMVPNTRLSVPLERVYYVKGDNPAPEHYVTNWSFSNFVSFAYGYSYGEEHYLSEKPFNAINPFPGDEKHIYFGKAPFTPASFSVNGNLLTLNGHLIRGYNNNSYLLSRNVAEYQIYLDGILKTDERLPRFDYTRFSYSLIENGVYKIRLEIPTTYPLWSNVTITALITVPASELQPPEFQHMEMPSSFSVGEELQIQVDLQDESGIETAEIYVKENGEWILLTTNVDNAEEYIYSASYTPQAGLDEINLKISATDTIGNSVSYEILPAALPSQDIVLDLGEVGSMTRGDIIEMKNRCKINDALFCNTFLIKNYVNNEFLENSYTSRTGRFAFKWQVPFDYDGQEANITIKYSGTGVYKPYETGVTIPVQTHDIDVGVFDMEIGEAVMDEPVIVSGDVRNVGLEDVNDVLVQFKVDGILLEETKISEIKSEGLESVSFEWLPERESYYRVELRVITESDDQNSRNDVVSEFTRINFIAPDIDAYLPHVKNVIVGTETDIELSVFNYGEEKAEDVKAYFYDFFEEGEVEFYFDASTEEKRMADDVPVEEVKPESEGTKEEEEADEEKEPVEVIGKSIRSITYKGIVYNFTAEHHGTFITVNISTEDFNDLLNFTFKNRIQMLENGIYMYMESFYSSFARFLIDDTSELEKNIGSVDVYEEKIKSIKWTPEDAGSYKLLLFSNTSKDGNFENNYFTRRVKVLRLGVNIGTKLLVDYGSDFIEGVPTDITVEIKNLGTEEARNIRVSLFELEFDDEFDELDGIKKKLIEKSKIKTLGKGETETLTFKWTPSEFGEKYLLLIAEAKNDINPVDNDDLVFVNVISEGADVTSRLFRPFEDITVGESTIIEGYVENIGVNSTNVSAALYEVDGDNRKLIGNVSVGTLEAGRRSWMEFEWTPDSSGEILLELVADASDELNKENNMDPVRVRVKVIGFDVKPNILSYPMYILTNYTHWFSVHLQNFGTEESPQFDVVLKANDVEVDRAVYETLQPNVWGYVNLQWIPTEEGDYDIEVVVEIDDSNNDNNIDKDKVRVFNTKELIISFVDKEGNFVERDFALGNYDWKIDEPISVTIPDAPLELWVGEGLDDGEVASIYLNSTFGDEVKITTAHISEKTSDDGLLLYEIFANNNSWNYETFYAYIVRELETLDISYTEIKAFICEEYNFSDDTCGRWEDVPSETLVFEGQFILTAKARNAQAFAIGDVDYDGDNAPDWDDDDSDNDGIPDEDDTFICFDGRFKKRKKFDVTVNDDEDINKDFKGKNKVGIKDKNKKVAEFDINFSKNKMDCREIVVEKQPEITSRGYTLINGVNLINGTKTLFVDKIANFNRVCVKDEYVDSIDELSQNCDGSNETMVICDGAEHSGYTCTDIGEQYKVEGLVHSAVAEPTDCTESWSCTGWSSCDGEQTRSCTDTNGCGTNFNRPSEEQSCDEDEDSSGERSGKSSRRSTFTLGEIKDWSDGKQQVLRMKKNDMIIFTFDNEVNTIIINANKATHVVLSLSWRSRFEKLVLGETKGFDIDKDNKDDLLVTLEGLTLNRATLVLERINPDARKSREADSKDEKDSVSRSTEPTPEELQKEAAQTGIEGATITEKKSFWPMAGFIVLIIALVPILIFAYNKAKPYLFKKETYPGEEERAGVGDQGSSYKQLHSYVLKEMDKGFTLKQITGALKKAGWKKEMIKLVMEDLKKRPKL